MIYSCLSEFGKFYYPISPPPRKPKINNGASELISHLLSAGSGVRYWPSGSWRHLIYQNRYGLTTPVISVYFQRPLLFNLVYVFFLIFFSSGYFFGQISPYFFSNLIKRKSISLKYDRNLPILTYSFVIIQFLKCFPYKSVS